MRERSPHFTPRDPEHNHRPDSRLGLASAPGGTQIGGMSDAITRGVRVQVESEYVPERSEPQKRQFFFSYRVRIRNEGGTPVKLQSRHWIITDAFGQVEHVRGAGVVGEQPRLGPGDAFEYTSACPMKTPHGAMQGSYQMISEDGEVFDVEIAPFSLSIPGTSN